jgi:hypothetical protein
MIPIPNETFPSAGGLPSRVSSHIGVRGIFFGGFMNKDSICPMCGKKTDALPKAILESQFRCHACDCIIQKRWRMRRKKMGMVYCDPIKQKRYGEQCRERKAQEKVTRAKSWWMKHKKEIIQKPCEVCGKKETQIHHVDYSKPKDIRWLCQTHHMQVHRKYSPLILERKEG